MQWASNNSSISGDKESHLYVGSRGGIQVRYIAHYNKWPELLEEIGDIIQQR